MFSSTFHQEDLIIMVPKPLHSRRLLLPIFHYPLPPTQQQQHNPPPAAEPPSYEPPTFDANVVMVLSVLLCALIGSLALNSIIRCILSCTSRTYFSVTPMSAGGTTNAASHTTNNYPSRLANTAGIKKNALKTFTTVTYSADLKKLPGLGGECVICLAEFACGDKVRLLPRCNHGFHVRCIDKWLESHSSCPTCRNCLIETCEKIVGDSGGGTNQQSTSGSSSMVLLLPSPPPQQQLTQTPPPDLPEMVVDMAPLDREDPVAPSLRVDT